MRHPAFEGVTPARRRVPHGYGMQFFGALVQARFFCDAATAARDFPEREAAAEYPEAGEKLFEYVDLIEAVREAPGPRFTMMELGAGYGRWLTEAGCAVRTLRPDLTCALVGVEAEPTHFSWMREALRDNGLDGPDCRLVHAAVGGRAGKEWFITGSPGVYYGQKIVKPGQWEILRRYLLDQGIPEDKWDGIAIAVKDAQGRDLSARRVPVVTLGSLLAGRDRVDLIHIDIQELEGDVVEEAIEAMDRCVRRVHIGTHSRAVEERLRAVFGAHGWESRFDYLSASRVDTPYGTASFQDGVQTWINPRLAPAGG